MGSPDELYRQYDVNYSLGGPIVRDRLWFFATGRHWAYNNYVLGGIKPDGSRYFNDNYARGFPVRITAQLSSRDRLTGLMNYSTKGQVHTAAGPWQGPAVTAPEATLRQQLPYEIIGQLKWTSTIGNRMLLETGFSRTYHKNDYSYQPEIVLVDLLNSVQPVCAGHQLRQPGQPRHRARLRLGRTVFRQRVRAGTAVEPRTVERVAGVDGVRFRRARVQGGIPAPVGLPWIGPRGQRRYQSTVQQQQGVVGPGAQHANYASGVR